MFGLKIRHQILNIYYDSYRENGHIFFILFLVLRYLLCLILRRLGSWVCLCSISCVLGILHLFYFITKLYIYQFVRMPSINPNFTIKSEEVAGDFINYFSNSYMLHYFYSISTFASVIWAFLF